jgi:hypothetical protein
VNLILKNRHLALSRKLDLIRAPPVADRFLEEAGTNIQNILVAGQMKMVGKVHRGRTARHIPQAACIKSDLGTADREPRGSWYSVATPPPLSLDPRALCRAQVRRNRPAATF